MTMTTFRKTIRSNSFAARLTAEQRDELFDLLGGGLGYREAAEKVRGWIKANDEAGLNGDKPVRELRLTEATTLRKWYQGTRVERRYAAAHEAAAAADAHCPDDYEPQSWQALDRARYLATLEDLRVTDIAMLERNNLYRQKLILQREKHAFEKAKYTNEAMLKQAYDLLALKREDGDSPELERLIDATLAQIERMKQHPASRF